jgi:hypothetical protein
MSKMFFGGMPTDIDVRRLEEAFPKLQEGDDISHEQVEAVIGVDHTKSRYRVVTNAWRKQLLRDSNIELGSVSGVGFRCLKPEERISGSVKGFQQGVRKQMRSVKRSALVRTDDERLMKKQDLLRRYGAAIVNEATNMMKEIEPPKPQAQMPRIGPRAA